MSIQSSGMLNPNINFTINNGMVEVTNVAQNISFILDECDIGLLYTGRSMFYAKRGGTDYIYIYNYYGNNEQIPIQNIIMKSELDRMKELYKNNDFIVTFVNNNSFDFRRCNLKVVSLGDYKVVKNEQDSVGIVQTTSGAWRMQTRIPGTSKKITKTYRTKIEAAIAYDAIIKNLYPEKNKVTNFNLGVYTEEDLKNTNVNINDININPEKTNSYGFKGLSDSIPNKDQPHNMYTDIKVYIGDGRYHLVRRVRRGSKDAIEMAAIREDWICKNQAYQSQSNLEIPSHNDGLLDVVGFLNPKNNK